MLSSKVSPPSPNLTSQLPIQSLPTALTPAPQLLPFVFTLFLPLVLSTPISPLFSRQDTSCADTCGTTCYWASDISAAVSAGYALYTSGQTAGSGSGAYPHQYNDYEGFDFAPVDGPYYEFPILDSFKVYSGGSPGADRVVFNGDGDLAGVITHTGARGDDFLQCVAGG